MFSSRTSIKILYLILIIYISYHAWASISNNLQSTKLQITFSALNPFSPLLFPCPSSPSKAELLPSSPPPLNPLTFPILHTLSPFPESIHVNSLLEMLPLVNIRTGYRFRFHTLYSPCSGYSGDLGDPRSRLVYRKIMFTCLSISAPL